LLFASVGLLAVACNGAAIEPAPIDEVEPIFPENVAEWKEGRPCGFTHEHDLRYIRVVVDEAARVPYQVLDAREPYAVGATLVKLEYDDENCTELIGYTAMRKEEPGYSELGHDWRWQRVDRDRTVTEDGELPVCITCHRHHCTWPMCGYADCGFDLTCGQELP
jgi:hypothetical protein